MNFVHHPEQLRESVQNRVDSVVHHADGVLHSPRKSSHTRFVLKVVQLLCRLQYITCRWHTLATLGTKQQLALSNLVSSCNRVELMSTIAASTVCAVQGRPDGQNGVCRHVLIRQLAA